MQIKSRKKFRSPQNNSGASKQNGIAFVDSDLFYSVKK